MSARRDLKKRVSSYFQKNLAARALRRWWPRYPAWTSPSRVRRPSALLLENNLIKSLRPRYNILFRDDKSYPYLLITATRGRASRYYRGATSSGGSTSPVPLRGPCARPSRSCRKCFACAPARTRSSPIARVPVCRIRSAAVPAPCVGVIEAGDYAHDVQRAPCAFNGEAREVMDEIRSREAAHENVHSLDR